MTEFSITPWRDRCHFQVWDFRPSHSLPSFPCQLDSTWWQLCFNHMDGGSVLVGCRTTWKGAWSQNYFKEKSCPANMDSSHWCYHPQKLISHLRVSSFCYTDLSFTSIWLASEIPIFYILDPGGSLGGNFCLRAYMPICPNKKTFRSRV